MHHDCFFIDSLHCHSSCSRHTGRHTLLCENIKERNDTAHSSVKATVPWPVTAIYACEREEPQPSSSPAQHIRQSWIFRSSLTKHSTKGNIFIGRKRKLSTAPWQLLRNLCTKNLLRLGAIITPYMRLLLWQTTPANCWRWGFICNFCSVLALMRMKHNSIRTWLHTEEPIHPIHDLRLRWCGETFKGPIHKNRTTRKENKLTQGQ